MARRLCGSLSVRSGHKLTLFGRSALLLTAELLANAACWIACAVLFGRQPGTRPILSLALLAWTIGLRHALDADHIRYFLKYNATRSLISMGQLPVTCGLFFSLGHSTIVIVVNVAIAISTDVYDRMQGVGTVGGIVGSAVSASFLFIVGLANSIILYRVLRKRHRLRKQRAARQSNGADRKTPTDVGIAEDCHDTEDEEETEPHGNTLMMRIIGPVVTFVDRPWKMYPVGVLFGFGFDTASSIALLAISAIAKRDPDGHQINPADIVILPMLFTVGMTLIDSLDSIIMLYSYAGFPERSFALFERRSSARASTADAHGLLPLSLAPPTKSAPGVAIDVNEVPRSPAPALDGHPDAEASPKAKAGVPSPGLKEKAIDGEAEHARRRTRRVKQSAMSNLSIVLTVMSILVAFSISLITTMGLIGDNCTPCQTAANADDGGGLAGSWWRGWAKANDNSGYIGAAIVGTFVFVVGSWYGLRFLYHKVRARRDEEHTTE